MMLEDQYHVVDFHFIDDGRCLCPLGDAIVDFIPGELTEEQASQIESNLRDQLAELFRSAGWEGDGEINCIFLPPCFCGREDGWCEVIYHVKQRNNGTSWLAIPNSLQLTYPMGSLSKRSV